MVKTSKQQAKAIDQCQKIIAHTQKALELIEQCPIGTGMVYVQLTPPLAKGEGFIEAILTPVSYSITSMRVFIHACTIRMFGTNRIQYSQILDFKLWEHSLAPLTINWVTQSKEYLRKVYNS
jgi:hypothetical protein